MAEVANVGATEGMGVGVDVGMDVGMAEVANVGATAGAGVGVAEVAVVTDAGEAAREGVSVADSVMSFGSCIVSVLLFHRFLFPIRHFIVTFSRAAKNDTVSFGLYGSRKKISIRAPFSLLKTSRAGTTRVSLKISSALPGNIAPIFLNMVSDIMPLFQTSNLELSRSVVG
jgi:hypothetical protein